MHILKALVAQLGSWLLIAALLWLGLLAKASSLVIATLQGILAAAISRLQHTPPWWLAIHAIFFPGIVLASTLQLSPGWSLAAFILLALVYWNTFSTQVPLYLSNHTTASALSNLIQQQKARTLLDLGSGTGILLKRLALQLPDCQYTGIESAPLPWLLGVVRTYKLHNCKISRGNFWRHSLTDYDVVYAFLSPVPMPQLWQKARNEMRENALLVSNTFPVPDVPPDLVIDVDDPRKTRLYLYHPAKSR